MAFFVLLELRKSQPRITTPAWSWPTIAPSDPDLIATALFCVIVLLVMLVVMLTFPDFGANIEQYHGI
jgi:hypothetical protein